MANSSTMDDLWKELQDADEALTSKMRAQYGASNRRGDSAAAAPAKVSVGQVSGLDPMLSSSNAAERSKRAASSVSAQQTAKLALMKASEVTTDLDLECDNFVSRTHSMAGSDAAMTRIVAAASNAPTLKAAQNAVRKAEEHIPSRTTQAASEPSSVQSQAADGQSTVTERAQPVRAIDYDDDEDLANALQRDIAGLADSSPVVRQACTRRLAQSLFGSAMGLGPVSEPSTAGTGTGTEQGQQHEEDGTSSLSQDVAAALQVVSSSPADDPEAAAVAALQGTSHSSSVPSAATVPQGLQQYRVAMDPAYTYSAHELSDVAAMIVGRTDRGEAVRRQEGGLATTTAASTGITRALAQAMRADPLRHWQGQAKGGQGLDTQHVRNLLRALWPRLQKPLLRCLGDAWEGVRTGALTLLAHLLTCGAVLDFPALLPLLMPALVERAGLGGPQSWAFDPDQKIFARDSAAADAYRRGKVLEAHQGVLSLTGEGLYKRHVGEPSEVGRAALARTVFALLEACARDASTGGSAVSSEAFSPYLGDVAMIAHALAVDTAPDVRVAGCTLLIRLCDLAPLVMRFFAVAAVKSIAACGGLDHRHAKVRLASLDAVDALVSFHDELKGRGAGTEAILPLTGGREANVVPVSAFYGKDVSVNYFAKLTIDTNPAVRLRFVHALGGWITRLPDRLDWWPYNLPYLLSALGDDSPVVSSAALEYLEAAGVSHETEHAAIIMERSQYGLDGDPEVPYNRPLPHPFTARGRPRIGVRLFVRAHARRFLKPVLAELVEFAPFGVPGGVDTRARAAALLVAMLVMEEEQATGDAHLLVRTLVKGVFDAEPAMRRQTRTACRLLGRYFDPKSWLVFLLPFLTGEAKTGYEEGQAGGEAPTAAAALTVLWLALQECMSRLPRVLPHVARLVQVLCSPRLLAMATPPPVYTGAGQGQGVGTAAAAAVARTQAFQARVSSLQALYSPGSSAPTAQCEASAASLSAQARAVEGETEGKSTAAIASRAKQVAALTASSTQTSAGHARGELSRALLACVCVLSEALGHALAHPDTASAWASSATSGAASGSSAGPKLNGMQQDSVGSSAPSVLSPGRAAALLVQLVLTLRGQEVLVQAEQAHAASREHAPSAQATDEKTVKAVVSYLKRDDDVNVRPVSSAHRWEVGAEEQAGQQGRKIGDSAVAPAIKEAVRISASLLCLADEALYRLSAALCIPLPSMPDPDRGHGHGQGPYTAVLLHQAGGGGQQQLWHLPACATALLAQPIERFMPSSSAAGAGVLWEYLLILPCLGQYPAHSGWDAHGPEHALLASLCDALALPAATGLDHAVLRRLPMLLDLGSTVLFAAPYFDATQTMQAGAKGVSTSTSTSTGSNAGAKASSAVTQREDAWASYLLCMLACVSGVQSRLGGGGELGALYGLLAQGLPPVDTVLQQWPATCLPQSEGAHATPASLWGTPALSSLSSSILACCAPPSSGPPRETAVVLLATCLAWAGDVVRQPSVTARATALQAASTLLPPAMSGAGPGTGQGQGEKGDRQAQVLSLARKAWRERMADAEEGVAKVAAGPFLLQLLSCLSSTGTGTELQQVPGAQGAAAQVQEALTIAANTGMTLTDFMGDCTSGLAPTVGDILLGTLLQVSAPIPARYGEAARGWLEQQGEEKDRAEGAVEMAKALVEHCELLASLRQSQ